MKGQITIEYLIIIVLLLILFTNISMDLAADSMEKTLYVQTNQTIRVAEMSVQDAVGSLTYQGAGARRSVQLRAPADCRYLFNATQFRVNCSAKFDRFGALVSRLPAGTKFRHMPAGKIEDIRDIAPAGKTIGGSQLDQIIIEKT